MSNKGNKGIDYGLVKKTIGLRQNFECFYCGSPLGKWRHWVLDHLIPRSAGGVNSCENRVASCKLCDDLKADRYPTQEELQKQERLI